MFFCIKCPKFEHVDFPEIADEQFIKLLLEQAKCKDCGEELSITILARRAVCAT